MGLDVEWMEKLRAAKGWSQEEAARRCGLTSKTNYNDIISGRKSDVRVSTLEKIAKGFGVPPEELLK